MSHTERTYTVSWKIEVDAASLREAAQKALTIQRDADSIAVVFHVSEKSGHAKSTIDLLGEAQEVRP